MITAYGRNDAVPNSHPLYIGPLGRAGSPEAAAACRRADLLLVVGSRLGQFTTHFDDRYIRPASALCRSTSTSRDIGRYYPGRCRHPGRRARGTAAPCSKRSSRRRACRPRRRWRQEAEALRAQRQARLGRGRLDASRMKPQRVYAELRRVLPPETIVALDAGAAPAYGYDRLYFAHPRTFLTPLDLGGLGFAFPVALGAKLGRPEAPVLAIHGDGGFLMNAQELETAVRHGINAVTLVMNNNCWGSEKAYQKHFYGERYIGCDIGNPRYDSTRGSSAPRATTSTSPTRSARPSRPRSAAASPPSSRSRSTPTSSRPGPRLAARGRRLARETFYPAPPISRLPMSAAARSVEIRA